MKQMWELIRAVEEADIPIRSVKWEEDGSLNIDVDVQYHDKAGVAIEAYWKKERDERMKDVDSITVPWEEGTTS